jgi:hypothetical protein
MLGMHRMCLIASSHGARRALTCTSKVLKSSLEAPTKSLAFSKPPPVLKEAVGASTLTSRALSFPKNHPFAFQLIIATIKTSAADLVCQVVAEGKSLQDVDWKRNGIFVVFGFTYLGGFQWWLMVHKYRQWFPTMDAFGKMTMAQKLAYPAGIADAGKMVLFDIFVHLPLLYFPTYYTVKEFVVGTSWNPVDWAKNGVTKYMKNAKEDLTAMVKLWGPSDCVQFALPLHIRMPFRHGVSFFWTAYVSFTRGKIDPPAVAPLSEASALAATTLSVDKESM